MRIVSKLLALVGLTVCGSFAHADTNRDSQMLLGNPDRASYSDRTPEHFLIQRSQYALSYNNTLHIPNWVSWHLNAADIGQTARGLFLPDPNLPPAFYKVTPTDYTRSSYDRGHNCPSADRSDTKQNNDAVFLMTNMTPQAHGLNAGPWEQLESYCRTLTKQGYELYIVCGHGFSAPTHNTIGTAKIAVPDYAWKIVVILPERSGNDLARINAQTRVIAVRMPNINTISNELWTRYLVTPGDLEKATGLHYFDRLPLPVSAALKAKKDSGTGAVASNNGGNPGGGVTPGAGPGMVWVNTKSGAYWRPGTQYYGKTTEGKYMTEADARKAGYHPAGGQ